MCTHMSLWWLQAIFDSFMCKGNEVAECERTTLFVVDHAKQEIWSLSASDSTIMRVPLTKGFAGWGSTRTPHHCSLSRGRHRLMSVSEK